SPACSPSGRAAGAGSTTTCPTPAARSRGSAISSGTTPHRRRTTMKRDEYLDRVRSLVPTVRERAKVTEPGRGVGEDSARELGEAGLFRALQPSRWGGSELDPQTFYEGVMELAGAW